MNGSDQEFQRQARFDLWMHQNELFWGRFQLLYFLQGALFAITAALGKNEPRLVHTVLYVTLLLMAWLYSTLDQDRRLRNVHGRILKRKHGFDLLPPDATGASWLPQAFWEHAFQGSVFLFFIFGDVVAADYFAPFCGGNLRFNALGQCASKIWHTHFW